MTIWLKNHRKFFYGFFVLGLFITAFILRLRPALIRPIIFDEAFTVVYLIKFNRIIDIINADASVPPLHYLLIKLMSLVSTKLIWLRFPSIIYSMLSLALIYKWINRYSQKVALFTLIFLTFSTFQINFAWQAYVYSQLFFFGLLSIYFFYQLFYEGKSDWWRFLGFFVFSLAAWFTHYGYIWTLAGILSAVFISKIMSKENITLWIKKNRAPIKGLMIIILSLLLFAPVFIHNFHYALRNIKWMEDLEIYSVGKVVAHQLGLIDSHLSTTFIETIPTYIATFLLVIIQIIYWIRRFYRDNKSLYNNFLILMTIVLLSNTILPVVISLLLKQSILAERSIIVALPIIILFSITLKSIWEKNHLGLRLVVIIIIYFYIALSIKINNNNLKKFYQFEEMGKEYVEWFTNNSDIINNNPKILFYSASYEPTIPTKYFFDYATFDYYWYGYDGRKKLPEYQKVTVDNYDYLSKDKYYLLIMYGSKGNLTEKISVICPNPRIVYQIPKYKWLNMNIYLCNE